MPVGPTARMAVLRRHTKVSLRGVIFCEIRQVRIFITNYLDVMSSWCFWSQPTWAELKRRYADRVEFDWKIAMMDGERLLRAGSAGIFGAQSRGGGRARPWNQGRFGTTRAFQLHPARGIESHS